MTIWPGALSLAFAITPCFCHSSIVALTSSGFDPRIASIVPDREAAARSISSPRWITSGSPVSKSSTPAPTSAAYSPRLCPATMSGRTPRSPSAAQQAQSTAKIAGWAFEVRISSSRGPSWTSFQTAGASSPSRSSTCRAAGDAAASASPMPIAAEPCPGKRNAILPTC